MKTVILCGGKGTRLREETEFKPKPLVEIGGNPILWHIMKIYAYYGFNQFVLCLGYKGNMIKDYFLHLHYMLSNFVINTKTGISKLDTSSNDEWEVAFVNTGEDTLTGGRISKIRDYVGGSDSFLATYGDGVSNINISDAVKHHVEKGKLVTLAAVRPSSVFGDIKIKDGIVTDFVEKPLLGSFINGGFFVANIKIFDYIDNCYGGNDFMFESLLAELAEQGELSAYIHEGFWQCMDTYKHVEELNSIWQKGNAPWKIW